MSSALTENLPIILIVAAIILALLSWLLSRQSSGHVKDLPATSTPLDTVDKTDTGIGDVDHSLAAEFVTTAPAPPAPQSSATPSKPAVRKAKPAVAVPAPAPEASAPGATKTMSAAIATGAVPDDLRLLKGVGPKLITMLNSLGVTSLQQVAHWSDADIAEIDSKLGVFTGRIGRDNWVDQAQLLTSGDIAGFEQKYGALGGRVK